MFDPACTTKPCYVYAHIVVDLRLKSPYDEFSGIAQDECSGLHARPAITRPTLDGNASETQQICCRNTSDWTLNQKITNQPNHISRTTSLHGRSRQNTETQHFGTVAFGERAFVDADQSASFAFLCKCVLLALTS